VDNVPYGRARETILAALFPEDHPYHHSVIGSMADLSAASLEDVRHFFRTYYVPNNASLAIVGDFDPDSVKVWVERYFGRIPRGTEAPPRPTVPAVRVARDTFLVLEDRVRIPRLYETWHTVKAFHPDDAALDVLAYVLAGDKTSRLYKRLVYDMQVAQDVRASQDAMHLDGMFQIVVTPKPGETPATMARLVNEEIARVIENGVTERELARAQNTIRARFLDRLASDLGVAGQISLYSYFANDPEYVRKDAARYDVVTAADVQRVARAYLGQPKVVLSVVPQGKQELMVGGAR
jgi:zinc protease